MNASLQMQAYEVIKSKIISLECKPNSIISEATLLQELDMSRTPIRESLIKLEQEHFVEIIPKRGILILPLSMADVNMIFDTRLLIEPFCVSTYHVFIDKKAVKRIRDEINKTSPDDSDAFYRQDDELHKLLATSNPNRFLITTLMHVYDQHNRIRAMSSLQVEKRYMNARNEHLKILDTFLAGDVEKTAKLLSNHLITSKNIAIQALMDFHLPI